MPWDLSPSCRLALPSDTTSSQFWETSVVVFCRLVKFLQADRSEAREAAVHHFLSPSGRMRDSVLN